MVRTLAYIRGDAQQPVLNHDLQTNWRTVRNNLHLLGDFSYVEAFHDWTGDEMQIEQSNDEIIAVFDATLTALARIDERSMVFRYPESLGGALYLQDISVIDVEELAARITFTHHLFNIWFHIADDTLYSG